MKPSDEQTWAYWHGVLRQCARHSWLHDQPEISETLDLSKTGLPLLVVLRPLLLKLVEQSLVEKWLEAPVLARLLERLESELLYAVEHETTHKVD